MRTMKKMFIGAAVALMAGSAYADVVSDRPAAILIWADIKVGETVDTIVQISNTSQEPILAHCFYENANSHCTNDGTVCEEAQDCCSDTSSGCGICEPGWLETDFRVRLTPRQPLGWVASEALTEFPLDGRFGNTGPDGSSNAGSRVPPVAEFPYTGALKCIAINDDGTPSDRNVLKGEATLVYGEEGDVAKHNAIGIQALEGAVNPDNELILGGGEAEYNGCLEHPDPEPHVRSRYSPRDRHGRRVEPDQPRARAVHRRLPAPDSWLGGRAVPGVQRVRAALLDQPNGRVQGGLASVRDRYQRSSALDLSAPVSVVRSSRRPA